VARAARYASATEPGSHTCTTGKQEYIMLPPADNPAPLSVTRAFVVQLRADTVIEQGHLAGRVEHVVSGQATEFEALETLLVFMARALVAEGEGCAEP